MIEFIDNILRIDGKAFYLEYNIKQILELKDLLIILFDNRQLAALDKTFPNLHAFDKTGKRLWVAEQPTTMPADYYSCIWIENNKLMAYSWESYDCILNSKTGKIIEKFFTK